VLERAQSAASSCEQVTGEEGEKKDSHVRKGTHPHCIRTKVKKYILWASWRRSFVKRGQVPYPKARDEKGTPFVWRYQKDLVYDI
jgi:hypothetical protein